MSPFRKPKITNASDPFIEPTEPDSPRGYRDRLQRIGCSSGTIFPETKEQQELAREYLVTCSDTTLRRIFSGSLCHTERIVDYYLYKLFDGPQPFGEDVFRTDPQRRAAWISEMCRMLQCVEPSAAMDLDSSVFLKPMQIQAEVDFYRNRPVGPRWFNSSDALDGVAADAERVVVALLPFATAETLRALWKEKKPGSIQAIIAWTSVSSSNDDPRGSQRQPIYQNPQHPSFSHMHDNIRTSAVSSNMACFRGWNPLQKLTFAVKGFDATPGSSRNSELMRAMQDLLVQDGSDVSPLIAEYDWVHHGGRNKYDTSRWHAHVIFSEPR